MLTEKGETMKTMQCGCILKTTAHSPLRDMEIIYCSLHAAAQEMKAELERLRNLVGKMDYEIIDAVIANAERSK